MNTTKTEPAVSPVIAVILLVMITMLIAAIIGVGFISMSGSFEGVNTAYVTAEYSGNPVLPVSITVWKTSGSELTEVKVRVAGEANAQGSAIVEQGKTPVAVMLDNTFSYASYPVTVTGTFSDRTESVILMKNIGLESKKIAGAVQLDNLLDWYFVIANPEYFKNHLMEFIVNDYYSASTVNFPVIALDKSNPYIVVNQPDNLKCSLKITGISDGAEQIYASTYGEQIGTYVNLYLIKTGWNPSSVKAGDVIILEITYTSKNNSWQTFTTPPLKITFT